MLPDTIQKHHPQRQPHKKKTGRSQGACKTNLKNVKRMLKNMSMAPLELSGHSATGSIYQVTFSWLNTNIDLVMHKSVQAHQRSVPRQDSNHIFTIDRHISVSMVTRSVT